MTQIVTVSPTTAAYASQGMKMQTRSGTLFEQRIHHWSEDAISASRLRERMDAFLDLRVGTAFNMSFTDFLNQPPYLCDMMLEVLEKRAPAQEAELQNVLDQFREGKGKK